MTMMIDNMVDTDEYSMPLMTERHPIGDSIDLELDDLPLRDGRTDGHKEGRTNRLLGSRGRI